MSGQTPIHMAWTDDGIQYHMTHLAMTITIVHRLDGSYRARIFDLSYYETLVVNMGAEPLPYVIKTLIRMGENFHKELREHPPAPEGAHER